MPARFSSRNRENRRLDRRTEQAIRIAIQERVGSIAGLGVAGRSNERVDEKRLALFDEQALGEPAFMFLDGFERFGVAPLGQCTTSRVEQVLLGIEVGRGR